MDVKNLIKELTHHLPDSTHENACWIWCWDELDSDAQESVKKVRRKANDFLLINELMDK